MGGNSISPPDQPRRAHSAEPRYNATHKFSGRPLKRLSSSATLQREAETEALQTFEGRPISPPPELSGHRRGQSSSSHTAALGDETRPLDPRTKVAGRKAVLEHYEVFQAIDGKDLDILGEIRDRAFRLLLERQPGGQTPMLYAMQHGKSHQEVVLFLVGAISSWINRLNEADFSKPATMALLKLARASLALTHYFRVSSLPSGINLKFAIDKGLARLQTDLIASFLQTLVMCEGDTWIRDQISAVSFALKAGPAGNPVYAASSAVRRFYTADLLDADFIRDVEE
ncbi:hypothetical protein DXG01_001993 [Tephrocybe rancida]|nr:hypothetical protein DXG01_001993 [Tephrocybe rancida]